MVGRGEEGAIPIATVAQARSQERRATGREKTEKGLADERGFVCKLINYFLIQISTLEIIVFPKLQTVCRTCIAHHLFVS